MTTTAPLPVPEPAQPALPLPREPERVAIASARAAVGDLKPYVIQDERALFLTQEF